MKGKVKPIPDEYHTLTPTLTVSDATQAIEFYKEGFGAEERFRMPTPDGKHVMHAELKIGNSIIMLSDEMGGMDCRSPQSYGGTPVAFYVYVEDVDAAFDRAVSAGAIVKMPVENMFWGDRIGSVVDPSGHVWTLATHVEEVSPKEMEKRGREFMEKMMQGAGQT
ncbi:MAG: VOC family protein [Sedimentisphaerales bacterium]|nr:VOC family protein [Sedimentisphaerales bacterium]